jgi:hypothetical protein
MVMRTQNLLRIALATACVLLVPLVAMQVTDEVAWGAADFVVAGALLFGVGLAYELLVRRTSDLRRRIAVGAAVAGTFLLTWVELAVGIFGTPFAGQ